MKKSIKILFINKFYWPWLGGVEKVCQDLAENVSKNFKVKVLVCNDKLKTKKEIINNVELVRASSLFIFWGMPFSISFFYHFYRLSRWSDIIHIHWPFPLAFFTFFLFRPRGKLVVTWHSDLSRQWLVEPLMRPFIIFVLKRATKIIVPTPNHLKYSKYLNRLSSKSLIIPFGINLKKPGTRYHKNLVSKIEKKYGKYLILSVGRLNYYKGIEYLIKAAKYIKKGKVVIIGEGQKKIALNEMINHLGLLKRVFILPHLKQNQLNAFFEASRIFVLPSIYPSEAFGLVQIEAMSFKKPVINTNLKSGVPWVSIHKKTGLTVQPKNPQALAESINYLLNNKTIRTKLGNNAYQRVKKYFTLDKMINSHEKLYNALFNEN